MEAAPDFETLSDDDLERRIAELSEQETKISYERRILHGRLDMFRAEREARRKHRSLQPVHVDQLADILSRKAPPDGWGVNAGELPG